MIASNEIPANRRVTDTTVTAMALTAKEMNSKYGKPLKVVWRSPWSSASKVRSFRLSRGGANMPASPYRISLP
jgi:hypothetical protein